MTIGRAVKVAWSEWKMKVFYPVALDWSKKGVVLPARNQGKCGSCSYFASAGAIESAYAINNKNKQPIRLSPQHFLDCQPKNLGCKGANSKDNMAWAKQSGVYHQKVYPYKGYKENCEEKLSLLIRESKVRIDDFVYKELETLSEPDIELVKALQIGPAVITVDTTGWKQYSEGIYRGREDMEQNERTRHAVLLVGYDFSGRVHYWKIQNSWNRNWGEEGYMRIERRKGDRIGVARMYEQITYPVIRTNTTREFAEIRGCPFS